MDHEDSDEEYGRHVFVSVELLLGIGYVKITQSKPSLFGCTKCDTLLWARRVSDSVEVHVELQVAAICRCQTQEWSKPVYSAARLCTWSSCVTGRLKLLELHHKPLLTVPTPTRITST